MMERFIYTIPSELIQSRLEELIQGKGAFRRFKDAIFNLGITEEWYKFRDECYNPSFTVVMLKSPKSIITSVKFSYS